MPVKCINSKYQSKVLSYYESAQRTLDSEAFISKKEAYYAKNKEKNKRRQKGEEIEKNENKKMFK